MPTLRLPPPEALVFDAVGTLLEPSDPVAETYQRWGRRCGAELPVEEIARRFRIAFQREEDFDATVAGHLTSEAHERQRWQRIVAEVFAELPSTNSLFEALWAHYARSTAWRLFPPAVRTLAKLDRQGVRWVVASNFDHRLHEVIAGFPELAGCTEVLISSELGVRKPARAFFQIVEQRLGVPPLAIAMVGDSEIHDLAPARSMGWQAIPIQRLESWAAEGLAPSEEP